MMDKNMSRNDGQSSNAPENDRIFRRGSVDLVEKSFPEEEDSFGGAVFDFSALSFVK